MFLLGMNSIFRQIIDMARGIKRQGSFTRNASIVFGGNALNLLIQTVFTPIISRIYTPEAYGEYAYYNLIVVNIGFFAAMSLPSTYILPKARLEYFSLFKLVVFSVIGVTLLSVLTFLLIDQKWDVYQGSYLAVPIMSILILLNALVGGLYDWNIRKKGFARNTISEVGGNLSSKLSVLLVVNLSGPQGIGLLLGDVVRKLFSFFTQTSFKVKLLFLRYLLKNNWKDVFSDFRNNINVIKYIFPAHMIHKIIGGLPIILIGAHYSKEMLGFYSFASAMLHIPKNLFSTAVRPVFLQKANELYLNEEGIGFFLTRIIVFTLFLTLIPTITLVFWGGEIFQFAFGSEWLTSGKVAAITGFHIMLLTVGESFAGIRRVLRLEKGVLRLSIFSTSLRFVPTFFLFLNISFFQFIFFYALLDALFIIFNLSDLLFKVSSRKTWIYVTLIIFSTFLLAAFLGYQSIN